MRYIIFKFSQIVEVLKLKNVRKKKYFEKYYLGLIK